MSWIEIKLNIPQEKMEAISAYIFAQGCEGINIADDNVLIYFSQFRWSDADPRLRAERSRLSDGTARW